MRLSSVICGAALLAGCTTRAIQDEDTTDDGTGGPGLGDGGSPGDDGDGGGPGGDDEPDGQPPGDDGGDPDDPTSSPGDSGTDQPDPPPGEPPEGITVWSMGLWSCGEGASAFAGLPQFTPLGWDEVVCEEPVDCTNNRTVEFGEPLFLVNGMLLDIEWVRVGDTVGVLIPFADPDCNLDCGEENCMDECPGDWGGGGGGWTGIDLPCSTESSGVWIGLDLMTLRTPGYHLVQFGIADRCGGGDSFEIEFSL
jgi:hypothetical protein